MKRLGIFLLPPGWDTSLSQVSLAFDSRGRAKKKKRAIERNNRLIAGLPQKLISRYICTHLYSWVDGERHCQRINNTTQSPRSGLDPGQLDSGLLLVVEDTVDAKQ